MSHLVRRVGGLVALTATLAACLALAVGIPRGVDAADGCVGPDSYCNPSTVPPAPTTTEATPSSSSPDTKPPSAPSTTPTPQPSAPTSSSPSTSSPDTSEPSSTPASSTPITTPSSSSPSSTANTSPPLDEPARCPTNPNEPVGSPDCPTLALPVTGGGWLLGITAAILAAAGALAIGAARRPEVKA